MINYGDTAQHLCRVIGKKASIAYANSKGSGEPALFAQVSGRPWGNFSQRTRRDLAKGPGIHTERLI